MFRSGHLLVSVSAVRIASTVRQPYLTLTLDDQILHAGETEQSKRAWEPEHSPSQSQEKRTAPVLARASSALAALKIGGQKTVKGGEKAVLKTGGQAVKAGEQLLKKGSRKIEEKASPKLVSAANHFLKRSHALQSSFSSLENQIAGLVEEHSERKHMQKSDASIPIEYNHQLEMPHDAGGLQGYPQTASTPAKQHEVTRGTQTEYNTPTQSGDLGQGPNESNSHPAAPPPTPPPAKPLYRIPADFGTFEFSVFRQVDPQSLELEIIDKASHLPKALTVITKHTINLPKLTTLKCTCDDNCNTHLLHVLLTNPGLPQGTLNLTLNIEYRSWQSLARDTIVTPRFRELLPGMDQFADSFKAKFPHAEKLTYLLVGGLFTDHYPAYFEKNKSFLQENLKLPRVQTVPIHTEGSIVRNAKIIRDSIVKTFKGSRSVVLIGHSKGGIDALSVLTLFPEMIPFLYGIITFQAPFGGTYLIDFLKQSKFAVSAISSVIQNVWNGDEAALLDMSYASRLAAMGVHDAAFQGADSDDEVETRKDPTQTISPVEAGRTEKERPECNTPEELKVFDKLPVVSFASYASFDILRIRTAATAAGVASMAPAVQRITQNTGFLCDGLVVQSDARVPFADAVLLNDMMHSEPALYVQGTRYPPGQLTASALVLLFEKAKRREQEK